MNAAYHSDWTTRFSSLCQGVLEEFSIGDMDPTHPAVEFYEYWQSLAAVGVPDRSDFRPDRVRRLLKWIMLLDAPEGEGRDFKVRLHGTAAVSMMHGNLTGSELNEFCVGDSYESRKRGMQKVIATGKPLFGRTSVHSQEALEVGITLGMFPFMDRAHGRHQVIVVGAPVKTEFRRML